MKDYGFVKVLTADFETVEKKVTEELKKEGFGVLTKIDIKEKFKEKLGIEYHKYIILGACNPPEALKALEVEDNIGLMLPCNIVIYEKNNVVTVGIIKPAAAMEMIDNPELSKISQTIEEKLNSVFDKL
ncbi:MAG: DUF302 domain-containing protein [Spirochaetia bacterium]|jgi:uncharacterized protein (DUF302 family)|nr:DUF302 domain-containing protein [Spirochaetia bacterium]